MSCNAYPHHKISPAVFECQQCGDCCKGYGGTYMTVSEIEAASGYVGVAPETFIDDYCVASGRRHVLKQGDNGYCVFWDRVCTIHPVKPLMCRAWPFIPGVLLDFNNWRIMAANCPGILIEEPESKIRPIVECEVFKLYDHERLKRIGVFIGYRHKPGHAS